MEYSTASSSDAVFFLPHVAGARARNDERVTLQIGMQTEREILFDGGVARLFDLPVSASQTDANFIGFGQVVVFAGVLHMRVDGHD